jgi:glucosamine kinase
MTAAHFLGVDGGGTRCRARIRSVAGCCLGVAEGDLANVYQDFSGAMESIVETARQAALMAGLPRLEEVHAGLGLAGVMTSETVERVRAAKLPFACLTVDSDAYAACLAAHGAQNGGIIIAGTGSAALALIDGSRHDIGGWGFTLGDDGSAAQLGRRALRLAILAMDGMGAESPLLTGLLDRFRHSRAELSEWARTALPRDYAAFAPAILAAAGGGDCHGRALVEASAAFLALMARTLIGKGTQHLSLIGGMAEAMTPYLPADVKAHLVPARADPVDGAIMMARRAAGLEALW